MVGLSGRLGASYSSTVDGFEWRSGKTLGSSPLFFSAAIAAYLCLILALRFLLKSRKTSVPLGLLPPIHNLILCVGSLLMFLGALEATINDESDSYEWLVCFSQRTKPQGRVFFWSYLYYLSKYYELIDTVILVLKKKPLSFLHVYHHSLVIIMCWLWLEYSQSLQTIGLLTNTGIHFIMYWYYFMHSMGHPPPWRKFVTNGQIVQFLFSFTASIPFVNLHITKGCAGFYAWLYNVAFNFTLLLLFFNFHRKQYGVRVKQNGSLKVA